MVRTLCLAACAASALAVGNYIPPERNSFFKLHGSGTTNPSKYLFKAFHTLQDRSPRPIKMTYDATGSSTGRRNFVNTPLYNMGLNDFSCSELPLSSGDKEKLVGTSGVQTPVLHLPFVIGAVSAFHTVPGAPSGGLKLSPAVLGKVFSGQITQWDHADIQADNAGWTAPSQAIKVVHRNAGSSSTSMLAEYLTKATNVANWPLGTGSSFPQCTGSQTPVANKCWFATSSGADGSGGVTTYLKATPYAIGYLDTGHGTSAGGLSEISVKNAAGNWHTSATAGANGIAAAAAAGVNLSTQTAVGDWSAVTLVYQAGATTWPMTSFSYFLVRKDLSGLGEKGSLVKAMIEYTLSTEGQALIKDFGFFPLCGAAATCDLKDKINAIGINSLTFAPSTCSDVSDSRDGAWLFNEHSDVIRTKVYASGTSNPSKLHWKAISQCTRRMSDRFNDVRIQYDSIGSGPGRAEYVNAGTYYAGGKLTGIARPAAPAVITLALSSRAPAGTTIAADFTVGSTVTYKTGGKTYTATVGEWNVAASKLFIHTPNEGVAAVGETVTGNSGVTFTSAYSAKTPDTGGYSLKYKSDFGCAELALTSAQRTDLATQTPPRAALHFPMVLGAIGIFNALPKYVTGCTTCAPDGGLQLSLTTLAKIYTGVITKWTDAAIKADNPTWAVAKIPTTDIYVMHRIKGSSSTYLTSEYLTQAGASVWPLGVGSEFPDCASGTSPTASNKCWFTGSYGARGSSKVAAALETAHGGVGAERYAIGYLDAGHGQSLETKNVHETKLKNKDGTWLTSKSAGQAGIEGAATSATLPASHEDWGTVSLVNQAGATTWPMVAFSYIIVDENLVAMHSKGALIKSYISYLMTADGQKLLPGFGFAKLPTKVLNINTKGLARITLADGVSTSDFDCSPPVHMGDIVHTEGPGQFTKIHGSGTTNPSLFLFNIFDQMYERMRLPIKASYDATGSSTGRRNFINHKLFDMGLNDFTASELPLSTSDKSALGDTAVLHLPFVLGAIAVFHTVPNAPAGGLKIDAPTMAKIFTGAITKWNDAAITALNPSWSAPTNTIYVVHRIKGSSSTSLLAEYLSTKAPSDWTMGASSSYPMCTGAQTPSANKCWFAGSHEGAGSGGVASQLKANQYAIGYLDSGHGHAEKFDEVSFKNKNNKWLTTTDAGDAGIGAAADNAVMPESHGDWSAMTLIDQAGDKTWPVVSFSYFLLRENLVSLGMKGGLVKELMQHVLSAEGQTLAKNYKFIPVPQKVTDANAKGLARVLLHGGTSSAKWKLPATAHTVKVYASGTTNPKRVHWYAMKLAEDRLAHKDRGAHKVTLSYDAIGSGPGRNEFASTGDYPALLPGTTTRQGEKITGIQRPASPTTYASVDTGGYSKRWKSELGCSELALSSTHVANMGTGKKALHLPLVIGAISFFHNVPEAASAGLKLSPVVLAKIFSRQITTWDHADIKAENPSFTVPANTAIKVVHRIKGSSSTALSTEYLHKAAGSTVWTLGYGSTITWPAATIGARGSGVMSSTLQDTLYSIGYLDSGHGHRDGLHEVSLKNKDGMWVTSKTADVPSAAASLASVPKADDMAGWRGVSLLNLSGPKAWPIVAFSYMLVGKDLVAQGDEGHLIKEYLSLLFSAELQTYATTHGFFKLPGVILDNNKAGLDSIILSTGGAKYDLTAPEYKTNKLAKSILEKKFTGGQVAGFTLGFGILFSIVTALCVRSSNRKLASSNLQPVAHGAIGSQLTPGNSGQAAV